jgi:hypothetical protein
VNYNSRYWQIAGQIKSFVCITRQQQQRAHNIQTLASKQQQNEAIDSNNDAAVLHRIGAGDPESYAAAYQESYQGQWIICCSSCMLLNV